MKSSLYTRTGDSGTTSLVGGQRISKASSRLDAYGTIDEFSAFLGIVLSSPECPAEEKNHLLNIQNRLFDVGAYLATLPTDGDKPQLKGMDNAIAEVEGWIDNLDSKTPKINAFILPGGSLISSHAHVARTVCRRAERNILRLTETDWVDPLLIAYINRLSDYLFILARNLNHAAGNEEIRWSPNL